MASMAARLRQRAYEKCIPLNVTLEITLRCNLRCAHCYNFDRDLAYLPLKNRDEELTDAEIHRILDEVREEGCLYLALTGGEALAHPHLVEFVQHGSRAGMAVTVKSNGTLLEPAAAGRIAGAGAMCVEVSLYGAEAHAHDAFVRMHGAFERTVRGAAAARDAGMRVKFSFVIVQRNADQLGRMIEMAGTMGIPYAVDPQITARYDGSRSSLDERVDRTTLERLYRGPLRELAHGISSDPTSVQCSCARSVCGISAFGEVYPCIGAPLPSGSLRERSFHDIWRNSPALEWIRSLRLEDFPACRTCAISVHCRRSSGVIFSNTGSYTGPKQFGDDWTCMEAEVLHEVHQELSPLTDSTPARGSLRRHSFDPSI